MSIFSLNSRSSSSRKALGRRRMGEALKAFTLIELVLVCAIAMIITALILVRQSKFDSATLLRSLGYSVALSMRQAQIYGTSVREFTPGSGTFANAYGVYFTTDYVHYSLFADTNGNGAWDSGEDVNPPSPYQIGNGKGTDYKINKFCSVIGVNTPDCSITTLTILFRRPNPEACIATSAVPAACAPGAASTYSAAYVQVTSQGGDVRTIKVTNTGQITICNANVDVGAANC